MAKVLKRAKKLVSKSNAAKKKTLLVLVVSPKLDLRTGVTRA